MALAVFQDIQKAFGPEVVFSGLNLHLYAGQKVGLIGPNGCGKTTLLKMITGVETPDTGRVTLAGDLKVGYLPQEPSFSGEKTVLEEMHEGMAEVLNMLRRIEHLTERMACPDETNLRSVMQEYDKVCHAFEAAGGYGFESRIKSTLAGLGFDAAQYHCPTSALSGGQVSRLGLAKILVQNTNCLLLDEPTNHLDLQSTAWLENFLRAYHGAVILISHDRYLLDRVTEKIVEIEHQAARVWKGNYSRFLAVKESVRTAEQREYKKRAEMVAQTLDFIARNKDQEGMRKTARGRKTRLNRLLKENPDFLDKQTQRKTIRFSFSKTDARSDLVLRVDEVGKRFDDLLLFDALSFELTVGQRVGITGPNGTGKTTLLKIILGDVAPDNGSVRLGRSIDIGYLDQHAFSLNPENSVLDEARTACPDETPETVRSRLGAFLFCGDDVFKQVCDLSGGQQNRLMLCKLVLREPDILILDEPTNHLDIDSRELLEQALQEFNGTILTVSHDRYFLDRVVDELLVLGVNREGQKQLGSYEWVRSILPQSSGIFDSYSRLLEQRKPSTGSTGSSVTPNRPPRTARTAAPKHLKAFNKYSLEQIESTIAELEEKKEQLNARFGDTDIYQQPERLAVLKDELETLEKDIALWYEAWEYRLG